jgi:hypothetical protein
MSGHILPHPAHRSNAKIPNHQHKWTRHMTNDEMIEKCVRAMLKDRGSNPDAWKTSATNIDFARKLVVALKALGVIVDT